METLSEGNCYRHPRIAAVRSCRGCGRPVCSACLKESGDSVLCPPCREQRDREARAREEAARKVSAPPPPEPGERLAVGEVTVFDDGRVEEPEPVSEATAGREAEEAQEAASVEEPALTRERFEKILEQAEEGPAPQQRKGRERRVAAFGSITARMRRPETGRRGKRIAPEAGTAARAPASKLRRAGKRLAGFKITRSDTTRQMISALPYGLITGAGVFALWLIFALTRRQWNQFSVFTAGIAVPWALYKGSTARRRLGARVWKAPPPAPWLSATSVLVLGALTPLAEYLAYRSMFRGTALGFSEFSARHLNALGIMLIVFGFVLAVGIPFVLVAGETRGKRKGRGADDRPGEEGGP